MTPDELAEAMTYAAQLWPNARWPESARAARLMRDSWMGLLGEFDQPVVRGAIDWISSEAHDFPPTPGQIRDRCIELTDPRSRPPDVTEALVEVLTAIRTTGRAAPTFSHPLIHDVVAAMGWRNICDSTNPETRRAQFIRLFDRAVERDRRMRVLPPSARLLLDALPVDEIEGPRQETGSALPSESVEPRDDTTHLRQLGKVRGILAKATAANRADRLDEDG